MGIATKPTSSFIPDKIERPTPSFQPLEENLFGLDPTQGSEENVSLWEHISRNYKGGKVGMVRNSYFRAGMWGEMPVKEAISKGNEEYLRQMETIGKLEEVSFREHPVRYTLGGVANTLPFMLGAAQEGFKTGLITGGGFATITAAAHLGPQAVITAPTAFASGMTAGGAYGVFKFSMDNEGAGMFGSLVEQGIDENLARSIAIPFGAVSGAIELGSLALLAAPFKKTFLNTLVSKPVKNALLAITKKYVLAAGGEWSEEIGQEGVSLASELVAGLIAERPDVIPTKEEVSARFLEVAQKSAAVMTVLPLPGAAINTAIVLKEMRKQNKIAREEAKTTPEAPIKPEVASEPVKTPPESTEQPLKTPVEPEAVIATSEEFQPAVWTMKGTKYEKALDYYTKEEYQKLASEGASFKLFSDKKTGYVIEENGMLLSLFSHPSVAGQGRGDIAISQAVKEGANKLECLGDDLAQIYKKHGFEITGRKKNWTEGEPDVILMERRIPYEQTQYYRTRKDISSAPRRDIGKLETRERKGLGEGERKTTPAQRRGIPSQQPPLTPPQTLQPSKEIVAEKIIRQEKLSLAEKKSYPDLEKIGDRFNELKAKERLVKEGVRDALTPFETKDLTRITEELGGLVREKIKRPPTVKKILGIEEKKIKISERVLLQERFKNIARGAREGQITTKKEIKAAQTEIINLLDASALEAKDKAKFIRTIKNIQTVQQLNKVLPEITERIGVLIEKAGIRTLKTKIQKEIKTTKTKKQAGKRVGKFIPEVQGALDLIKTSLNLDKDSALDMIQKNIDKTTGLIPSEDITLQNEILTLFSDFDNKSIEDLTKLLDTITTLKEEGKEARQFLRIERKEHIDNLKSTVVSQVAGKKGMKAGVETTGGKKTMPESLKGFLKGLGTRWIGHWNTYMDIIEFNAGVENKKLGKLFSTLVPENAYKDLEHNFREKFDDAITDAYGIKSEKEGIKGKIANVLNVHKKIHELSKEVNLGKFKNAGGVEVELIFTKDELIKKWMELQDPTLRESFEKGNKYTDKIISSIENKLSDKDKTFARVQFALYKEQWKRLNPFYRKFFGVDLAFNEFYSPIAREGYYVDSSKGLGQLIEDTSFRVGVTAKSMKARVKNILSLKTRGSIYTLDNHFKETNYFMAWAEKIKDFEATFKDAEVRGVINQEFSPGVYKAIITKIEHLANKGNINATRFPVVDFFRKGFTVGRLMIKPALTVKQFVSTVAYYEKVGIGDFVLGAIDFWKNPVENYKTLQKESIFIKTRGAGMERDMKAATQAGLADKFFSTKAFANLLLLNNRIGDKGAIVWGSWILRKARLKQKVALSEVISEYEEFSADTQQSADISRLSEVQMGSSIERLFTMFKTSQRQYLAKELTVVRSLFQEGGTSAKNIKKVAKTMAIYHVLLPVMFQFIANGGGWDEDDQKEYIRAGLLGSLNGLFIFGDFIDSILRKALGLRVFNLEIPITSVATSVKKAIGKMDWDDINSKDVMEALSALSEAGDSFYLPVSTIKNFGVGVSDIINKDVKQGILEMLGWSKYIVGDKESKKYK